MQAGPLRGQLPGPVPDPGGQQQFPARRRPQAVGRDRQAALIGGLEEADLLDLVAPELDPERVLVGRREHVKQAAADRDLAPPLDEFDPRVPDLDQMRDGVLQAGLLTRLQLDRRELTQPRHHRLQQAAHGRRDNGQRAGPRVRRVRMCQPAQDRQPLAGGVRARRQPLVRQRLPSREVTHCVRAEQRAEAGREFLGFARGRGDGQHERAGRRGATGPGAAGAAPAEEMSPAEEVSPADAVPRAGWSASAATSRGRSAAGAIRSPPRRGS